MQKFSDYVNEAGPKALTGGALAKYLSDDKNWEEHKETIYQFFEDGDWSKGDSVRYDIMELMYQNDWSWQDEYGFTEKKTVWTMIDKRIRMALKKIKKEYVIDKGSCYKQLKAALSKGGDIYDDIVYAILDKKKNAGVQVEYPKFEYYTDVTSWMDDFDVTSSLKREVKKDDICLLVTEGIDSISITSVGSNETISAGSRTSAFTIKYKIDIVTYSTEKVLSFEISKTEVNRI